MGTTREVRMYIVFVDDGYPDDVVAGVFETEIDANRAIEDIEDEYPEMRCYIGEYVPNTNYFLDDCEEV